MSDHQIKPIFCASCGHERWAHVGPCRLALCSCEEFMPAAASASPETPLQGELLDLITLMPNSQTQEIIDYILTLRKARGQARETRTPRGPYPCQCDDCVSGRRCEAQAAPQEPPSATPSQPFDEIVSVARFALNGWAAMQRTKREADDIYRLWGRLNTALAVDLLTPVTGDLRVTGPLLSTLPASDPPAAPRWTAEEVDVLLFELRNYGTGITSRRVELAMEMLVTYAASLRAKETGAGR